MTGLKVVERPKLGPNDQVIDEAIAIAALPHREIGAHKWGVGGLVIVAGAPGYAGAAVLCAQAAGRAGAGIVNVALPRSLASVLVTTVPEAATIPLPEGNTVSTGKRSAELIEPKLEKSAALVVGPGLGQDDAGGALLGSLFGFGGPRAAIGFGLGPSSGRDEHGGSASGLIAGFGKPLVIDADGLNWLATQDAWWERLPAGQAVLTPHVGEMARLLGVATEDVTSDPIRTVREAAGRWRQTVVLKYGYTAVSDGEQTLVAADAPPSLATAGSGDVLAGVIGAFLAQGVMPLSAAALAIFVGARAARLVERRTGVLGLVAGDLPLAIAAALAELERAAEESNG